MLVSPNYCYNITLELIYQLNSQLKRNEFNCGMNEVNETIQWMAGFNWGELGVMSRRLLCASSLHYGKPKFPFISALLLCFFLAPAGRASLGLPSSLSHSIHLNSLVCWLWAHAPSSWMRENKCLSFFFNWTMKEERSESKVSELDWKHITNHPVIWKEMFSFQWREQLFSSLYSIPFRKEKR